MCAFLFVFHYPRVCVRATCLQSTYFVFHVLATENANKFIWTSFRRRRLSSSNRKVSLVHFQYEYWIILEIFICFHFFFRSCFRFVSIIIWPLLLILHHYFYSISGYPSSNFRPIVSLCIFVLYHVVTRRIHCRISLTTIFVLFVTFSSSFSLYRHFVFSLTWPLSAFYRLKT